MVWGVRRRLSQGAELPFTFIVDDPSGNSFVENPYLPKVSLTPSGEA